MGMNEIQFTQGDSANVVLFAEDEFGEAISLSGVTFSTAFPGRTSVVTFGDDKHTILDSAKGKYSVNLDSDDTASIEAGQNKDILSTLTKSGKPITFRGIGVLEVYPSAQASAPAPQTNIFMGAAL